MTGRAATLEFRHAVEIRADAPGRRLEGYAAIFGTEARLGTVVEVVLPGAFRASLASGRDILALADHDPTRVLARTRSGTLKLTEDAKGLVFDLALPDTQAGRDVLALAERGDLGGMSFGFIATDTVWPQRDRRELRAVELHEVSVISSWPAYPGTTVQARSWRPPAPRLEALQAFLRGRGT
jgi:HK97 family phage prohead protease